MRRLIFFILLLAVIGGTSCLLVFGVPGGVLDAPPETAFELLKGVFESIKGGTWPWSSFNLYTIFIYGYVLFLLINAVLLLSLLVMALTTLFRFSKIYRFFATVWWHFLAALVFTGVNVYLMLDAGGNFMDHLKELPWQFYMPLGSAIVLAILGIILKKTERNI